MHAAAAAKATLSSHRHELLAARLSRHEAFSTPLPGSRIRHHVALTPVDALPTAAATSEDRVAHGVTLFGVLYQPEDGLWCLDDGHKSVLLDLSGLSLAGRGSGFFTEGCSVIVAGAYHPDATHIATGLAADAAGEGAAAAAAATEESDSGAAPASRVAGTFGRDPHRLPGPQETPAAPRHRGFGPIAARARPDSRDTGAGDGGASAAAGGSAVAAAASGSASVGGGFKHVTLTEGRLPGVLQVSAMRHPPAEAREGTVRAMGIVDPLRALHTPAEFARVKTLEGGEAALRSMVVVMAELHLDSPIVLDRLHTVFSGFVSCGSAPTMFVLMGNFASRQFGHGHDDRAAAKARFDLLADTIGAYPLLAAHSHFVLVPGPNDPGAPRVLPRQPIPASFCDKLLNKRKVQHVTLASNPARLRFFTQVRERSSPSPSRQLAPRCGRLRGAMPVPSDSLRIAPGLAGIMAGCKLIPWCICGHRPTVTLSDLTIAIAPAGDRHVPRGPHRPHAAPHHLAPAAHRCRAQLL